jgi:hypothetical protein
MAYQGKSVSYGSVMEDGILGYTEKQDLLKHSLNTVIARSV